MSTHAVSAAACFQVCDARMQHVHVCSGGTNIIAIDLITEHIRGKLGQHVLRRVYPNLEIVPSNYQTRGM